MKLGFICHLKNIKHYVKQFTTLTSGRRTKPGCEHHLEVMRHHHLHKHGSISLCLYHIGQVPIFYTLVWGSYDLRKHCPTFSIVVSYRAKQGLTLVYSKFQTIIGYLSSFQEASKDIRFNRKVTSGSERKQKTFKNFFISWI